MSFFDERFLMHRLRSSSAMGIISGSLAAVVTQGLMLWYRFTD